MRCINQSKCFVFTPSKTEGDEENSKVTHHKYVRLTCSAKHVCRPDTRNLGGTSTRTAGSDETSRSPFPPAYVSRNTSRAGLPDNRMTGEG